MALLAYDFTVYVWRALDSYISEGIRFLLHSDATNSHLHASESLISSLPSDLVQKPSFALSLPESEGSDSRGQTPVISVSEQQLDRSPPIPAKDQSKRQPGSISLFYKRHLGRGRRSRSESRCSSPSLESYAGSEGCDKASTASKLLESTGSTGRIGYDNSVTTASGIEVPSTATVHNLQPIPAV